jgi:hypothetical protein
MNEGADVDVGFSTLLQAPVVERVRRHGALLLDVDDTILLRERAGGGRPETFSESAPAALLPELLMRGFRLCLITGHGWKQLESRLIDPLTAQLSNSREAIQRLHIYANRGATKILWDGARHAVDEAYGARHQFRAGEIEALNELLRSLADQLTSEVETRPDWYRKTFPRFDFKSLPPTVAEREGAVLVLRPVPTSKHSESVDSPDLRDQLCGRGFTLLQQAKLSDDYEIAQAGRSSIEITRRGVSKEGAVRDLIAAISASSGETASRVEQSMVYIGDEFFPGGNDYVMPGLFRSMLCLSVESEKAPDGVISLRAATGRSGPPATEAVLRHFLNLSV